MATRSVVRRDRKNHSNLRPKHKHTKHYLQHYWPYLPLVTLVLVGLWLLKPVFFKSQPKVVLAASTSINAQELLSETNQQRDDNQAPLLRLNSQLSSAAQAKAQDMINRNYWSHNTPDGSPPWTFISDSGYQYQKAGENLAYGFGDSSDTVAGWMNSPTHRDNILDKDFLDVGFGIATSSDFNHSGPSTLVVALYGRSVKEAPTVAIINASSDAESQSFNTAQKADAAPKAETMSKLDIITGRRYPWVTPLVAFVSGVALTILVIKHSFGVKKAIKNGEKFVVSHPVLDVILVSVILGGLFVTQQVGIIL